VDEHCRLLAAGCVALQAELASQALLAADSLPLADQLDPGGLLLASTASRGAGGRRGGNRVTGADGKLDGVTVLVPGLDRLRLG